MVGQYNNSIVSTVALVLGVSVVCTIASTIHVEVAVDAFKFQNPTTIRGQRHRQSRTSSTITPVSLMITPLPLPTTGLVQHATKRKRSSIVPTAGDFAPLHFSSSSSSTENTQNMVDNNKSPAAADASLTSTKDESSLPSSFDAESASTSTLLEKLTTIVGSTTSIVVAGTFYLVLCCKRDALMVSFFGGAISNGILSKVLKKVLNIARPADLDTSSIAKQNGGIVPSDNGMPSSHAMSLGFICTFTAIQLPILTIPLLVYTIISLRYRINTKLHSVDQIVVGAILGSFNGVVWHSLCFGTTTLPLLGRHRIIDINVIEWVSMNILNSDGVLPWYLLSVPALVGAAVVGSIERRLSQFFGTGNRDKNGGDKRD